MNATKTLVPIRELQKSLDRSFRRTDLQLRRAGLLIGEIAASASKEAGKQKAARKK